jgi:hypothetical protein
MMVLRRNSHGTKKIIPETDDVVCRETDNGGMTVTLVCAEVTSPRSVVVFITPLDIASKHPVLHERGSLTAAYPWRILTEGSG